MNDTRCQHIKDELTEALLALNADIVNPSRVLAILDDARNLIVDIVDAGISSGMSKADLNHLDSARNYINSAIGFMGSEWKWDAAEAFIGHSIEHIEMASTNVVPLRRPRNTPGGGAA